MRNVYSIFFILLTACILRGSDNYLKSVLSTVHPIQQEIIKLALKTHGFEYIRNKNKAAEKEADEYNAKPENHRGMVPSWGLETVFRPEKKESDQLTKIICDAVAQAQKEKGQEVEGFIPGETEYKIQPDGSINCYTDMSPGSVYMWAEEYSKKNPAVHAQKNNS